MVLGREPYRPIDLPGGTGIHRGPLVAAPASMPDAVVTWKFLQDLDQKNRALDEAHYAIIIPGTKTYIAFGHRGGMFLFIRNRLSASHFVLMSTSLS